MNTVETGSAAEQAVCEYLHKNGFEIMGRNWKTPTCEIDIIARKSDCVFFVEVKYRAETGHGTGFDYVTTNKLSQMAYAARLWSAKHHYSGAHALSAASVMGPEMSIEFIEHV